MIREGERTVKNFWKPKRKVPIIEMRGEVRIRTPWGVIPVYLTEVTTSLGAGTVAKFQDAGGLAEKQEAFEFLGGLND